MRKNIINFLTIAIFETAMLLFWIFVYNGHINTWYYNFYFDTTWCYFKQFLYQGGLLTYVGSFFCTFFRWKIAGAIILTLPVIAVWSIFKSILTRSRISPCLEPIALFPAVVLFACQQGLLFFFERSLAVVCLLSAIWLYFILRDKNRLRYILLPAFILVPAILFNYFELILIYFGYICVELLYGSKKGRFVVSSILFLLAVLLFSVFGNECQNISESDIHYIKHVWIFVVFMAATLLLTKINAVKKEYFSWSIFIGITIAAFATYYPMKPNADELTTELQSRLNCALVQNNYDEILRLTSSEKKQITAFFPFAVFAHACKNELPEQLLQYPITSKTNILPPAKTGEIHPESILNIRFYQKTGSINEAIHEAFLLSNNVKNGETFIALMMLCELNIEKGDYTLAEKYLNKLQHTIVHKKFIQEQKTKINKKRLAKDSYDKKINQPDSTLFFIGTEQHINLGRMLLKNPDNKFVRDYFLCSLLQQRAYRFFCETCSNCYFSSDTEQWPQLYQEAIIMARDMGIKELSDTINFTVSDEVKNRWITFKNIFGDPNLDNRSKEIQLRPLRHTWWFYAMFSDEKIR